MSWQRSPDTPDHSTNVRDLSNDVDDQTDCGRDSGYGRDEDETCHHAHTGSCSQSNVSRLRLSRKHSKQRDPPPSTTFGQSRYAR